LIAWRTGRGLPPLNMEEFPAPQSPLRRFLCGKVHRDVR